MLATSLIYTSACHKKSSIGPTVTITSPAADDQFANDLVIKMKGEIADAAVLFLWQADVQIRLVANKKVVKICKIFIVLIFKIT